VNVALGPVLKIWHEYRNDGLNNPENAELPPVELLKEAAKHIDIDKVIIDKENSTVFLEETGMRLDVGAIAKGYAVEQVSLLAMENGFQSALLSIGGNVRAIGDKGFEGQMWNVGIQNPDKSSSEKHIQVVYMADISLVSSGNYERYYTVDGKDYHHIIDPVTLYPSEYFNLVAIICKDSGQADALSTALFLMPFEEGMDLINSLPETDALWVMKDGSMKYSEGFESYLKKGNS
ncbi:MAG: FAD:protein FMN transferase, partial [Eubacteriales bacterium]|nr:FAD:protein FMN transferase [Eubacteriales bacterium]